MNSMTILKWAIKVSSGIKGFGKEVYSRLMEMSTSCISKRGFDNVIESELWEKRCLSWTQNCIYGFGMKNEKFKLQCNKYNYPVNIICKLWKDFTCQQDYRRLENGV